MAREAGQAVTSFTVRRQFADGDTVCSIIDWEMALPGVGRMTSAELLQVVDGVIVRGELIYDGEALRRAMAQRPGECEDRRVSGSCWSRYAGRGESAFAAARRGIPGGAPAALLPDYRLGAGRRRPGAGDAAGGVARPRSV